MNPITVPRLGADYFRQNNGQFQINGAAFNPPDVPVLLQILNGARSFGSLMPNGSMYYLPPNKVIELSFTGGGNVS